MYKIIQFCKSTSNIFNNIVSSEYHSVDILLLASYSRSPFWISSRRWREFRITRKTLLQRKAARYYLSLEFISISTLVSGIEMAAQLSAGAIAVNFYMI